VGLGLCIWDGDQIMIRPTALLLVSVALVVAGCSERPQVAQYKQGTYQGKPDTPPYQGAPFNGDKAAWDRAMATRAQNQNEYKRTN
jgi:hypothetical protein